MRTVRPSLLPVVIVRLGDAKQYVREKTQLLLQTLLEQSVFTPQQLFVNLEGSFSHRNSKIREEILSCFVNTLNKYGSQSIALRNFIPTTSIMVSDKNGSVRDTAFSTIIECYKHIGDPLRTDLQRMKLSAEKLAALMFQFDEMLCLYYQYQLIFQFFAHSAVWCCAPLLNFTCGARACDLY